MTQSQEPGGEASARLQTETVRSEPVNSASKSLIERQEAILARLVRKAGAVLVQEAANCEATFAAQRIPDPLDLSSYLTHVQFLQSETRALSITLGDPPALASAARRAASLAELTRDWVRSLADTRDVSSGVIRSDEYFRAVWQEYSKLCQQTVLRNIPGAAQLQLTLIEFDTETSGVPLTVLPSVVRLEETLVIDSSQQKPQVGFAYAESVTELAEVLGRRQTSLFAAYQGQDLVGFYIPVFNSQSVQSILGASYEPLLSSGAFPHPDRIGWVEIVGTAKHNRLQFARAGVNLYDLFDEAVIESGQAEGVRTLVGSVRQGENANLAIHAHLRKGWQLTGITKRGADPKNEYQFLVRDIPVAEHEVFERPLLGHGSHFERYHNAPVLSEARVEVQPSLQNSEAVRRVQAFFSTFGVAPDMRPMQGAHAYYILLFAPGSTIHYNLHQVRPQCDFWSYVSPLRDGKEFGTLAELLPGIARDMGFRGHCHDDLFD